jgi:hypothetical protein
MKVNTKNKILAKHFDSENQKVKKSHPDYAQINMLLHDYKYRLELEHREKLLKRNTLSSEDVKDMMFSIINGESQKAKQVTFFSAFDEFIEERKNSCKHVTIVKYRTCHNLLKDFEKNYNYCF